MGTGVLLLAVASTVIGENAPNGNVLAVWTKPGTEWVVHVRQYSRAWGAGYSDPQMAEEAQKPRVQYEFHMRITVLEPQGEGAALIARIRFTPSDDAPEFMLGECRILELDAKSGRPKAIKHATDEKGGGSRSITTAGAERVLFTEMYGFPTDWIVSATDLAAIPNGAQDRGVLNRSGASVAKKLRETVTETGGDQALEVEATAAWHDSTASKRVVQTWVPGEGWWRSFARYKQGHLDLEATLVEHTGE